MSKDFYDQLQENMIIYGVTFTKITTDKNGNITREIINPEDLNKEDYEQIEITEYYRKKND